MATKPTEESDHLIFNNGELVSMEMDHDRGIFKLDVEVQGEHAPGIQAETHPHFGPGGLTLRFNDEDSMSTLYTIKGFTNYIIF